MLDPFQSHFLHVRLHQCVVEKISITSAAQLTFESHEKINVN